VPIEAGIRYVDGRVGTRKTILKIKSVSKSFKALKPAKKTGGKPVKKRAKKTVKKSAKKPIKKSAKKGVKRSARG
jgi:hypothetical protein